MRFISTEGDDYITIEQIYDGYITSIKMNASKSIIALLIWDKYPNTVL